MMKRFIILSLLITLVSVTATAQTWQYITNPGTTGRIRGNVVTDSVQFFSGGFPVVPSYLNSFPGFKIVGDSAKRYSPTSHTWVPFGSESTAWGNIPGIISTQTDLMAILNAKQNKLPIGTTAQYYDGTLALKNFKNDVNGAIDTFRTATRGRLYKVDRKSVV